MLRPTPPISAIIVTLNEGVQLRQTVDDFERTRLGMTFGGFDLSSAWLYQRPTGPTSVPLLIWACAAMMADSDLASRRRALRSRKVRDSAWYFETMAPVAG